MSSEGERRIVLGQWDGANDGWGASLPLAGWSERMVVVDARAIRFAVPTFILRLRTFVDWHRNKGRAVTVLGPRNPAVRSYLARVGINRDLPKSVFPDLPNPPTSQRRSEVLIPVTRLEDADDVEELGQDLRWAGAD